MNIPRTGFNPIRYDEKIRKSPAIKAKEKAIGMNNILKSLVKARDPSNTPVVATNEAIPVADPSKAKALPISCVKKVLKFIFPDRKSSTALKRIEDSEQVSSTQTWPVVIKSKSMKINNAKYVLSFPILYSSYE